MIPRLVASQRGAKVLKSTILSNKQYYSMPLFCKYWMEEITIIPVYSRQAWTSAFKELNAAQTHTKKRRTNRLIELVLNRAKTI